MTLSFSKSWIFLWLFLASLVAISCLQDGNRDVDAIDIHADSTLLSLTTVKVTLLDSTGHELQVLFDDSVTALSDLSRLRLDTPYRGQVSIRIEGWKDGVPAYLEVRDFDLTSHELNDVKVVFHPSAGISRPPVLSDLLGSVEIPAGDTLHLIATAHDPDGPLAYYNWRFTADTLPDTTVVLSDSSANITGSHVYLTPGDYQAILSISDFMTVVSDTVLVTVKAITDSVVDEQDTTGVDSVKTMVLSADAGVDATVGTDSLLVLHGRAKGGLGPIVGYAWKIGLGANDQGGNGVLGEFGPLTASGDTSFRAPLQPGIFMALLMATDSAGQNDVDTVLFTMVSSANANLAEFTLGGVDLDPIFKPAIQIYTASVPFETKVLNLGVATAHPAATVKVGTRHMALNDSAQITLLVGDNLVEAVVLSQNGAQKKYQVTVTRRKSTETHLASLGLTTGILSPSFHRDSLEYTVAVNNEVDSIALIASALDSAGASLFLVPEVGDSMAMASGKVSPKQSLDVGARVFLITVMAQDGAANRSYRVSVTRKASPNAMLLSLTPSSGTLKPSFQPEVAEYFDTLPYTQTTLKLRGVPANVQSKLFQGGEAVPPDVDGKVANLPVGDTTLSIVVRAEAGDTNTYRVRVHRKSNDATLKALTSSVAGLPKGFTPGTLSYKDTVGAGVVSLTVNPVTSHPLAKAAVASPVTLIDGVNAISIAVTAEDGNTLIYTWNVYRISGSAGLSALVASAGNWSTLFQSGVFTYLDTVPESVAKLSVKVTPTSSKSKVYFQNKVVATGAWADSANLMGGVQTLNVKVVSESGDSTEYILTLYRTSADAQLKSLSISPGSLSPAFAAGNLTYTDTVSSSVTSITVAGACASVRGLVVKVGAKVVSGNTVNESVNLVTGPNTIPITVRSEEGNEVLYILQIYRQSSNASLSKLVPSYGRLLPTFSAVVYAYVDTMENRNLTMTFTPTAAMANAKVKVRGISVLSGQPSQAISLALGLNSVEVEVTAEDPAVKNTYTISVYRHPSFCRWYGGLAQWGGTSGMQLADSSFIMAGYGPEVSGGAGQDVFIMKTNQYGDSLWLKGFSWKGSSQLWDVRQSIDGGFVMAGTTNLMDPATKAWIAKTNAQGDTLWARTFGGAMGREAKGLVPMADGSVLYTGTVKSDVVWTDLLLGKVNADGSLAWERTYHPAAYYSARGEDIVATPDGGFVVVGTAEGSPSKVYLLKLDAAGDTVWTKMYTGKADLRGESIANVPGGGFMITGCENYQSTSQEVYFIRTDAAGAEIWSKAIAGTAHGSGFSIRPSSDNAFIASGYRGGTTDIIPFLMKIDKDGKVLLETVPTKYGTGYAYYAQDILGGGYLVIGSSVYLTKTDASGTVTALPAH